MIYITNRVGVLTHNLRIQIHNYEDNNDKLKLIQRTKQKLRI